MTTTQNELTAAQIAWLSKNGIETEVMTPCYGFKGGRVFSKGEFGLTCYHGTTWELESADYCEDGDGVQLNGSYATLKEGLRALAAL